MILFLDFDGVLHPHAVYLVRGRPELRAEGKLFMWAEKLVEALADHSDIQIVLSTSWVRELRFNRARDCLPLELRARVVGATWHSAMAVDAELRPLGRDSWWDRATRYQQITRYVERADLKDWIALDDDACGWADIDNARLIKTEPELGLGNPVTLARLREALSGRTK
jgi:hypothetical protein